MLQKNSGSVAVMQIIRWFLDAVLCSALVVHFQKIRTKLVLSEVLGHKAVWRN